MTKDCGEITKIIAKDFDIFDEIEDRKFHRWLISDGKIWCFGQIIKIGNLSVFELVIEKLMQGQSPTSKLCLHIRNYVGNSNADIFFPPIAESKEMETYKGVVENMNKVKSELNLCCEKWSTKWQRSRDV
jgi:hypothetical protein